LQEFIPGWLEKVMKKLLLALMTAGAIVSGASVQAADLGVRAAPPALVPAPVLTWTGFYVGVNGGGGWGQTAHDFTGVVGGLGAATGNFKANGGLAGGTVGYNYQAGAWVGGIEADFDWANIKGTFTAAIPAVATGSLSTELKWLNTVRGRVGYTWGPSMIYITGGAAWMDRRCGLRAHVHAQPDRQGRISLRRPRFGDPDPCRQRQVQHQHRARRSELEVLRHALRELLIS
jgi:hypothetical protein